MVLAVAVKGKGNNVLFLKGAELTEKHIQIMRNSDVRKVVVEGSPVLKKSGKAAMAVERCFASAGDSALAIKIRDTLKNLLA